MDDSPILRIMDDDDCREPVRRFSTVRLREKLSRLNVELTLTYMRCERVVEAIPMPMVFPSLEKSVIVVPKR